MSDYARHIFREALLRNRPKRKVDEPGQDPLSAPLRAEFRRALRGESHENELLRELAASDAKVKRLQDELDG